MSGGEVRYFGRGGLIFLEGRSDIPGGGGLIFLEGRADISGGEG